MSDSAATLPSTPAASRAPRSRDRRLDTMRGFAIIVIVAAHAVSAYRGLDFTPQALLGGTHYVMSWSADSLAVDLTYSLALPLFGFVTGMTLFLSRRTGWSLVGSRARSLLVPYLAWLALGTVLVAVRSGVPAVPGNLARGLVSAGASSSLWFLYALFVCVCVFALCRNDRALVATAFLAPAVMALLAWERIDVLELRDAAWLYAPLVAGYLVAKHRPAKRLTLAWAAVFAVAFALVAAASPYGLVFARLPLAPAELLYSITRVVGGVGGCLALYAVVPSREPFAWLGCRTLGIYALHPIIIEFLRNHGVGSAWLAALGGLLGATAITLAIELVPLARELLLGQRRPAPPARSSATG